MEQLLNHLKPLLVSKELEYPESDGKPMGETQIHIQAMLYLFAALQYYFRQASQIYVSANMLLYHEEGDITQFVVPDVFVVQGVSNHVRRTYKMWEEGKGPTVVFEITSKGTRIQDLANKRGLYEMLGVREYFLFDPLDEYLKPRLQGFTLVGGGFQPIELQADGSMYSRELGLSFVPEDKLLRLRNPETGELLPTFNEAFEQAEAEAERAAAETERAMAEAGRAAAEAQRADLAEAELAKLAAELERLRRQKED